VTRLDAQVHVWLDDSAAAPWPSWGGHITQRGGRSPTGGEVIATLDQAGVAGALLVPPSFAGDSNEAARAVAARYPGRFAVMGRVPLGRDGPWREDLGGWAAAEGLLGLRLTFGPGPSTTWLSDGTADWVWPAAEAAGLPVMVSPRGRAGLLDPIARRHPGLRLIVDHLGLAPPDGQGDMAGVVTSELLPLAGLANVAVKASALPAYANDPFPFRSVLPLFRMVHREFGAERVFWGSDFTRLPCTYREAAEFLASWEILDAESLDAVLGTALCAYLGWAPKMQTADERYE
jgi:predicted TIM-barrel fold metal-dependent hydrolase